MSTAAGSTRATAREFFEALSACASEQAGLPLRFEPPACDGAGAWRLSAAAGSQRLNRSRMLFFSSSLGAARQLVLQAQAADAAAVGVFLVVPLAADVDHAFGRRAAPPPARPSARAPCSRSTPAAPGRRRSRGRPACAACRSRSRPPPPRSAGSRRTRRPSSRWWCRSCRRCRGASACPARAAAVPERVTSCSRLVITKALRASMRAHRLRRAAAAWLRAARWPLVSVTLADQAAG